MKADKMLQRCWLSEINYLQAEDHCIQGCIMFMTSDAEKYLDYGTVITIKLWNMNSTFRLKKVQGSWNMQDLCSYRPISLIKWIDKLVVKLFALQNHQINLFLALMSSFYYTVFWFSLFINYLVYSHCSTHEI